MDLFSKNKKDGPVQQNEIEKKQGTFIKYEG